MARNCRDCRWSETSSVLAGSLDSEPAITPVAHLRGLKAPWFDITDELPQFADANAPPMGSSPE
jgi:hypothetical protein